MCDEAKRMVIDAKGLRCPMPLLKAKQALRKNGSNNPVTVLTTDASSERDFRVFAEHAGLQLVFEQCEDHLSLTLCEYPK